MKLFDRWLQAWKTRDYDTIAALYHEDFIFLEPTSMLTREEFLDGIFEQLSNPNFEISWECLHEDATSIILKWRETHGEGVFENHLGLSFIEDGKFWRSIVKDV